MNVVAGHGPQEEQNSLLAGGDTTLAKVAELCSSFDGRAGVAVVDLQDGKELLFRADEIFATASAIKLAILIVLMEQCENGITSLDDLLMLRRSDAIGGSGVLQYLTPGLVMQVRDWAFLMMNVSDNVATNVLIDHVGLANVQKWLAGSEFSDVQLHRKIDFDALALDQKELGTATPRSLNRLMAAVFRREIVSPTACDEMMRMMDKVGADRIGRYLPFSPFFGEPSDGDKLRLAGKTGSLVGTRCQTAAVWRGEDESRVGFVITVMSEGNPEPERWSVDAQGVLLIGRIARVIYDEIIGAD
jgi:beta-lactamase class A